MHPDHARFQQEYQCEWVEHRPPALDLMARAGLTPNPWQRQVLSSTRRNFWATRRGGGASTAAAFLSLAHSLAGRPAIVVVSGQHQWREAVERLTHYASVLLKSGVEFTARTRSPVVVTEERARERLRGWSPGTLVVVDNVTFIPDGSPLWEVLDCWRGRVVLLDTVDAGDR